MGLKHELAAKALCVRKQREHKERLQTDDRYRELSEIAGQFVAGAKSLIHKAANEGKTFEDIMIGDQIKDDPRIAALWRFCQEEDLTMVVYPENVTVSWGSGE